MRHDRAHSNVDHHPPCILAAYLSSGTEAYLVTSRLLLSLEHPSQPQSRVLSA
jgi:hypothetical protein